MKKILATLLIAVFFSAFAYALNTTDDSSTGSRPTRAQLVDDDASRDMAILRKKLGQMKREMDLLIREVVSTVPATSIGESAVNTFGSDVYVDVLQNEKNVIVKADLPGMEKDKINVTLDNDRFLKMSGAREILKSEKSPGLVRQERFFGNFSKVIELPCEVTPVGINAIYKDGVLEITIPKKALSAKEDSVKINVK